jgi:hypothetical protein
MPLLHLLQARKGIPTTWEGVDSGSCLTQEAEVYGRSVRWPFRSWKCSLIALCDDIIKCASAIIPSALRRRTTASAWKESLSLLQHNSAAQDSPLAAAFLWLSFVNVLAMNARLALSALPGPSISNWRFCSARTACRTSRLRFTIRSLPSEVTLDSNPLMQCLEGSNESLPFIHSLKMLISSLQSRANR